MNQLFLVLFAVVLVWFLIWGIAEDYRSQRASEKIQQRLDEIEAQKLETNVAFEKFKDELFSR